MAAVRIVLLAVLTVLFVTDLSLVFTGDTGVLEKAVLLAVAVLVALAVPRVQRLGRPRPAPPA